MIADKGYRSRDNRVSLRRRGVPMVIPERDDQLANQQRRGHKAGRPCAFDPDPDRDAGVVERALDRVTHWRGIATRYDTTALNDLADLRLAAILMWADDLAHPTDRS